MTSFLAVGGYVVLFSFSYKSYFVDVYGYFGFRGDGGNFNDFVVPILSIFGSLFFMPKSVGQVSDFLLWQIFALGFIPIQLTLAMSGTVDGGSTWTSASLFASLFLIRFVSGLKPIRPFRVGGFLERHGVKFLIFIGIFFCFILTLKFRSIMTLAGIEGVYEQRAAASEFGAGRLYGYALTWLTYAIIPLTIAVVLYTRKYALLFLPLLFVTVVYSITAAKLSLVLVAMCIYVYCVVSPRFNGYPAIFVLFPSAVVGGSLLVYFSLNLAETDVLFYVVSQLVMRAVGAQAMIFNAYAEFFSFNPFTYYSHVTGVSFFVSYPFDDFLGRIISVHLLGHPDANANSGFWATDGIAAAGNFGLLLIGLIVGFVFAFFDGMSRGIDVRLSATAFTGLSMMFVNLSLFTALVTGGGLVLAFMVRAVGKRIKD